ncbi:DUF4870 family protein [Microbulbifer thermotolerans]|uniref:Transmembrane protein n=1 Tax=Microbulbifer thermotolerans TaxID=252514 RepID=A0A143HIB0_MICTH|nr:hypothetical protein [Microbulbifer thermotolerans]AMX01458.1 hypothetical protein A3224_01670 [Microbulbifer thermotolerans]MCX2800346.1 hypothetical protein [Microbulbifer thermotolerans]
MSEQFPTKNPEVREQSGRDLATLVYLIQAIALFTAVPFFVAVLVNYFKRGDVRGTLAESHFRWQIRTFWFWLLWTVIGSLTWWLLGLGFLIMGIAWVWAIYRVVRGWLALADHRPAY